MKSSTSNSSFIDPDLPIPVLHHALVNGRITSASLVEASLSRIKSLDSELSCFVLVDEQGALSAAKAADSEIKSGNIRSLLHGIPYAIKDVYDVEGMATTCHSFARLGHIAQRNSSMASRLNEAGAILLGKLATHEFALGEFSTELPFPPARNPWNKRHIPGGSSSGPAAAVAAGYVRFTLGTCTGGSIRIPAAWCGVVGLKPTYGRVSRSGVFPLAPSLDHCGPIAASVAEAAAVLQSMAGHDPSDPGSVDHPVPDYSAGIERGMAGLRIGLPVALFQAGSIRPEIRRRIGTLLAQLQSEGAEINDVDLAPYTWFTACGRVISSAESFAIHAEQLRHIPHKYSSASLSRLATGFAVSEADYQSAQNLRQALKASVDRSLENCDVLLAPITLDTAPPFDPLPHFKTWPAHSYVFNVSGHPAISVPIGLCSNGLPMAIQIAGRYFDEGMVFRVARSIEKLTAPMQPRAIS